MIDPLPRRGALWRLLRMDGYRRTHEPERPLPGTAYDPTVDTADAPQLPAVPANYLDPHRPIPAANAWPDDAVLITYGELRALVALHLDNLSAVMSKSHPWEDAWRQARAIRDGEAPLLLSDVLDRP